MPKKKKKCNWCAWIIRICIALFLLAFLIYAIIDRNRILDLFEKFIEFIRDYPYVGPLMIVVAYIFATVLFLPGLVLTLGAGFALNQAYENLLIALPVATLSVFLGA